MHKGWMASEYACKLDAELINWTTQVVVADIQVSYGWIPVNWVNEVTSTLVCDFTPWYIQIFQSIGFHYEVAPNPTGIYAETTSGHVDFN